MQTSTPQPTLPDANSTPQARPPSPRVSVVLVNWNRFEDVKFCLESLRKCDYPDVQIIVVDNSSDDGSAEKLAGEPDVRLVCLCKNCGPCEARNVGMTVADGKYVMFLDSDAIVARDTLRVLVARMEGEADLGILGCRILNYKSRKIDQWMYSQSYAGHGNRPFDTYAFSAAGAMLRADVVRKAGGMWERLFIYNEEVELAMSVIRAGYRVGYEPDAHVLHNPSSNGRVDRSNYFFYQTRNWVWIFFKHYPFWQRWKKVVFYGAIYLVKGIANRYPRAVLKGLWAGLRGHDIVAANPVKMTPETVRTIDAMNRGRKIRLSRLRTGVNAEEPTVDVDTGDLALANAPGHVASLVQA